MRRAYRPIRKRGQLGDLQSATAQIQQVAANAGFSGDDLATAVAIALAESGGNPNNYNKEPQDVPGRYHRTSPNDGLGSYGLWQIYLAAHPEFSGMPLLDPQTNANAAYSIYSRRGGFSDWTTYNTGAYVQYLSAVPPLPLTIDASTGQPIADTTPTPDVSATQASLPAALFPASPSQPGLGTLAGVAAAGIALYVVLDEVFS
jgi:Lysozyme like domain